MGMNFSPMYQPVSTKTIKADGDLNVNPYDLLATDVKCDTVEASEFVGGVGNFSSTISSSYIINLMISNEGVDYGGINGTSIVVGEGTTKTIPPVSLPKNIGLFTVGNIIGNAPNYQIILTTVTNYSHEFNIVCNGIASTVSIPGGTSTYTFDTGVSVLQDLNATIRNEYGASASTSAYIKIPNMVVAPAQ